MPPITAIVVMRTGIARPLVGDASGLLLVGHASAAVRLG
jgi:hypothetical protein